MASNVFLDTSFLKALLDERDEFHAQAKKIWEQILETHSVCLISNFILDEAFTLIRHKNGREVAEALRSLLIQYSEIFQIIRVTSQDEQEAWNWFSLDWSKLSFTDCISFAQLKRLNISQVASFDHHFERAGFTLI